MEILIEKTLPGSFTGTLPIKNSVGSVTAEELHRAILVTQEALFSKVITADEWINSL